MGKISPVSAKYIIHATINIEGVVEKPDVIGAIFGQTEGLLGSDLELRELQRSGRIGRIEVNLETKSGKTNGTIIIPSSLDKAETSIIGAALEIIQRIGPCNAKVKVSRIEDVRTTKRSFVIERAKELLKQMLDKVFPDSQEITEEVAHSVRMMEIREYGKERLPAGPLVDDSDDIIVVEGRADVLNLLKHGIKNTIAINGTSVPHTIAELSKKKTITAFLDGDRGGDIILQELLQVADIDFVARAPTGKEVEEITKKEIHMALRARITAEQAKLELDSKRVKRLENNHNRNYKTSVTNVHSRIEKRKPVINSSEKQKFSSLFNELIGTRAAYVLDNKLNILGKVPTAELLSTIKSLKSGIYAVILDSVVDKELVKTAEGSNIKYIVGLETRVNPRITRINILTADDL